MNRASSLKLDPCSRPDLIALRRWVVAFCIIRFDLEQGQVIEECFPPGSISQDEELNVAFSSFPDSMSQNQNSASIHDCMFFFRLRRRGTARAALKAEEESVPPKTGRPLSVEIRSDVDNSDVVSSEGDDGKDEGGGGSWTNSSVFSALASVLSPRSIGGESSGKRVFDSVELDSSPSVEHLHLSEDRSPALQRQGSQNAAGADGDEFLYGYVFNRQRQDQRLKRGGEQKSVVILTHRPYSSVFKPLLQILGPLCFDIGKKALDHVAIFVSRWPRPVLGELMDLPIGSASLKAYLPPAHCLTSDCGNSPDEFVSVMAPFPPLNHAIPQGLFHEADLFGMFRGIILQLWMLWELLIIGEPLLIIAPTPSQCSEAVACIVSLAAPLPCSVDFRPYFTIHDPDFAHLNSLKEGDQFPPMILGVTNFFFLKALRSIPHVISVGSSVASSSKTPVAARSSNGRKQDQQGLQLSSLKKFSPSNLIHAVKMRRDGPLSLMTEHKEAVWSTYQPTTKPDTAVLNRLVDAGVTPRVEESMSVVNNEILRRHFLELTTNFLAPFGPYLRVTTPSGGTSPFVEPPSLPSFHTHEFLENLSERGPGKFLSKRMRTNWLDLYRHFLKGHNFSPWFQRRRAAAEQEQRRLWRQARIKADVRHIVRKMSELEIVDSFHAIERYYQRETESMPSGRGYEDSVLACRKLKGDLQFVFNLLPKDVQHLLLLNPQRAALLQGGLEKSRVPGHPSVVTVAIEKSLSGSAR
ncbi:unnamed protein product [Victoria cruziana]